MATTLFGFVCLSRFSVGQKCLVLILFDVIDSRECRSVDATLPVCAPTIPIAEWVGALLYVHLPMANDSLALRTACTAMLNAP